MTVMSIKKFLNFVHCYLSLILLVKYPSLLQNYISWAKCLILFNETYICYVILYCVLEYCHNLVLLYLYFIILCYYFDLSYIRSVAMFTLEQSFFCFFCLQRLPTQICNAFFK